MSKNLDGLSRIELKNLAAQEIARLEQIKEEFLQRNAEIRTLKVEISSIQRQLHKVLNDANLAEKIKLDHLQEEQEGYYNDFDLLTEEEIESLMTKSSEPQFREFITGTTAVGHTQHGDILAQQRIELNKIKDDMKFVHDNVLHMLDVCTAVSSKFADLETSGNTDYDYKDLN